MYIYVYVYIFTHTYIYIYMHKKMCLFKMILLGYQNGLGVLWSGDEPSLIRPEVFRMPNGKKKVAAGFQQLAKYFNLCLGCVAPPMQSFIAGTSGIWIPNSATKKKALITQCLKKKNTKWFS